MLICLVCPFFWYCIVASARVACLSADAGGGRRDSVTVMVMASGWGFIDKFYSSSYVVFLLHVQDVFHHSWCCGFELQFQSSVQTWDMVLSFLTMKYTLPYTLALTLLLAYWCLVMLVGEEMTVVVTRMATGAMGDGDGGGEGLLSRSLALNVFLLSPIHYITLTSHFNPKWLTDILSSFVLFVTVGLHYIGVGDSDHCDDRDGLEREGWCGGLRVFLIFPRSCLALLSSKRWESLL